MKKTSIVLLIFSAVLIISGIILCSVGNTKANNEGIQLFKQVKDSDGNLCETIDLSNEKLNKINVNIPNANVTIYGNSPTSYIEIFNLNAIDYAVYTNNRALTIENDLISALVNRVSGGDLGYNGLRDYFRISNSDKQKQINIYLTEKNDIKFFDISIKTGNIVFDGIKTISDYKINLTNGDIKFQNTPEISNINAVVNKGNVDLISLFSNKISIDIKNGNLSFTLPKEISYKYSLTAEMGVIDLNGTTHNGTYTSAEEETDGEFKANVGIGNIKIKNDE